VIDKIIDISLVVFLSCFSLLFLVCAIAGIIHAIEYLV
jgi:hypothetical protein